MQIAKLEPQARANLLLLATAYCKAKEISMVTLGRYATGTATFFTDLEARHKRYLRDGDERPDDESDRKGSFTVRVYDRLIKWFDDRWPPGVDQPTLADLTHNRESESHGTTEEVRGRKGSGEESQKAPHGEGRRSGNQAGSAGNLLRRLRGPAVG